MGIRTPVTAVKGRCPRPLDDGDLSFLGNPDRGVGGARRDRTADLLHAMQALSQLSYGPTREPRNLGKALPAVKERTPAPAVGDAMPQHIAQPCGHPNRWAASPWANPRAAPGRC